MPITSLLSIELLTGWHDNARMKMVRVRLSGHVNRKLQVNVRRGKNNVRDEGDSGEVIIHTCIVHPLEEGKALASSQAMLPAALSGLDVYNA